MQRLGVVRPGGRRARQRAVVTAFCGAVFLAACGSSSTSSAGGGGAASSKACVSTTGSGPGPWGWPGDSTQGYLAPNMPDVDCDGSVTIGLLSPGDTHDRGFYESFVDEADTFAQQNGWKVITVDKINPADAVTQARNLCRQHVDMVAVGASELKDAIPVSQEEVCRGTVWYVAGGQGVNQTPYFVQSQDDANESGYASGYAAGLLMKAAGVKKAGFVTGPQLDFAVTFAKAWYAGIKAVVADATIVVTYTGSFDDSAKGVEAVKAQLSQGIGLVYPYLGGATDAVAAEANKSNISVLTPGTNRCGGGTPSYAISVIFSPGDYFAAALAPFKAGTLRVGTARVWHMGKDPVPSVKICNPTGNEQSQVDSVIQQIGAGTIKPDDLAKATTLP